MSRAALQGNGDRTTHGHRIVRLGDVADLCLGKMLDAKKNRGTALPYLRNPNVGWFRVHTAELKLMPFEDHELDRYGLIAGDVVICEGGEAGRAAIWDGSVPGTKFQKAIHRVRPGRELFNRYLVYQLKYDYETGRLADYYTGTTIKHLTGQDLARYTFNLPPLEEQRRITAILDAVEALLEKRRQSANALDNLVWSIFEDIAGDPAKNPYKYPMIAVSDVVEKFETGKNIGASEEDSDAHQRVLKVSAVTKLEFIPSESKPLPTGYSPPAKHFVRQGDLLFSRANTTELIGATAFVWATPENIVLPDKLWRFVWKSSVPVEPLFMWYLFRHPFIRAEIAKRATGTSGSMRNVSQEKVLSLMIPWPKHSIQILFARVAEHAHRTRMLQLRSMELVSSLVAITQHQAFRGEL